MPSKPSIDLNDTGNRIIAGILLALLFVGGWWLIARTVSTSDAAGSEAQSKTSSTTTDSSATSVRRPISEDTPTISASTESIDVADQAAGISVKVEKVALVQVGWVAVRDGSGRTLGAARFEAGTHTNVEVPLLRSTVAGQSYQALMYVDDGNKQFDLREDILITKSDGSVAGDVFLAR